MLTETFADFIAVVDCDGHIHHDSSNVLQILATTVGQLQGRNLFELVHPDDLPISQHLFNELLQKPDQTHIAEFRLRHRDGSWRNVEVIGKNLLASPVIGGIVLNSRDVTARKRAEQNLLQSEVKYRRLFTNMSDGFALAELLDNDQGQPVDWLILEVNDAFTQHTGIARDRIVGHLSSEVFPASMARYLPRFAQVVATQTPVTFDTHIPANGRHLHVVTFPAGGHCFAQIIEDVTQRKQAEAAVRESEQRERERAEELAVLIEAIPTPVIIVHDPDARHMTGNRAADELVRIPRGTEVSLSAPTEFKPSHFKAVQNGRELRLDELPAQRAARGELVKDFEFDLVFDDGTIRHLLGYGTPLQNGQGRPRGAVHTLVDITARKQAEVALQRSEALYRAIGESIDYGVWVCAPDGRNTYVSESFLKLVGLTQEQCGNFGWGSVLHPDDAERTLTEWKECVRTGGKWDVEHRFRGADGHWHHVLARGVPVKNEHGTIIAWAGINLDINRLKQAEERVRVALAEKAVLLKEIHHRVTNNLQTIASLVNLQAGNLTDDRLRALFGDVSDRVRTMALVHEALYQTGDLAQLNFADYAARLMQNLWRAHRVVAGQVKLQLAVAPVILPVQVAVDCGLILNELASNILKHAFPDGRSGKVTVALDHNPATGAVCLRVRDNGVGLPAGLDWRHTRSLGLRLVQMLASQLHGSVETGPGPGTEFQVIFSIKDNPRSSRHLNR